MAREQPDYLSYLLRLWRVTGDDKTNQGDEASHCTGETVTWRASLESALTGERKGFASLDDLFDFLRRQTDVSS
jgi:hypothetical protein